MITVSTIRPGILVNLNSTISGNVSYRKQDIEAEHLTAEGERKARWETEKTVSLPDEHEQAVKARGKARSTILSQCVPVFGGRWLLCPTSNRENLMSAIADSRRICDAFNASASLTRIEIFVCCGEVAQDDRDAIRSINSEVRSLLSGMEAGIRNLDPAVIRENADKARALGAMLTADSQGRIAEAIEASRKAAREIKKLEKAGEQAAIQVDRLAILKITQARSAFIDMEETAPVATPEPSGRAIDFDKNNGGEVTDVTIISAGNGYVAPLELD